MLVSPNWFATRATSELLVVVDCRFSLADPQLGHQQYLQGHIPGAYYLDLNQDLSSPVQAHGGRHPLPHVATLAAKLSQMGITAATKVVAYDDSRFAFAARLWWLLRYMGHDRAAVLDGGFAAYRAAGLPVTSEIPAERSGQFVPKLKPEWVVDRMGVRQRQNQPNVKLVDSREGERYRGEREPIDPVAGHIPGAVNYPWQQVTDEGGRLRSPQDLRTYWSEVATADEIVVYCGSGVTACVNLLALEAAGIQTGKLYAGSWSDWCSYPLD
ncbi:sulfurtransferase [Altericista sp. CCNU0014]|uniref:sulfurtransferase n=1 Tax=Altericista sp. CCNU0014 TaxID=3082949 RepID=UPI00384BBA11